MHEECLHQDSAEPALPQSETCEECVKEGEEWAQLRMCVVCGHVGCCDASWGRHARQHFEETGHAVIKSIQPGHNWSWCYVHKTFF